MKKRRKLARVGDVISCSVLGAERRGKVIKRQSEYLIVALEEPRVLADWEHMVPAYSNPMEDSVYLHGDYIIEEYGNG